MNQEQSLGLTAFIVLFMLGCCVYMRLVKSTFTINKEEFVIAGVMEYHDNGNTVYIPVFQKRK